MKKRLVAFTLACFFCSTVACAAPISWSSWELTNTGAAGSMTQNGNTIDVTYTGNAEWISPAGYWWEGTSAPYTNNSVVDNAPVTGISMSTVSTGNILTFSQAVIDPVFALYSVGRFGQEVRYAFDQPFTLLSEGQGPWGDGSFVINGTTLSGYEGCGVIQFSGAVTSISWDNPDAEYHHGFTVGAAMAAPVPEPATLLLFGTGLVGLVAAKRKKDGI